MWFIHFAQSQKQLSGLFACKWWEVIQSSPYLLHATDSTGIHAKLQITQVHRLSVSLLLKFAGSFDFGKLLLLVDCRLEAQDYFLAFQFETTCILKYHNF